MGEGQLERDGKMEGWSDGLDEDGVLCAVCAGSCGRKKREPAVGGPLGMSLTGWEQIGAGVPLWWPLHINAVLLLQPLLGA